MSQYAKVVNNVVVDVIEATPDYFDTFVDSSPGTWVKTDIHTQGGVNSLGQTALRGNYAGKGYTYDATNDVFYPPQPYPSWTIFAPTWLWQPPTPMPTDGKLYAWDEATKTWVAK